VKAWSAGSAFDAPLNTGGKDDNGVPVPPLTTRTEKAKWWLRGRRYLMTVRGRKEFVEAYRAFKNNVGRTSPSPGRARVENMTGGSCVHVGGDRLVATRAQLACISVKVRVHLRPPTEERWGLLRRGACILNCRGCLRLILTLLRFSCLRVLSHALHPLILRRSFSHNRLSSMNPDPPVTYERGFWS